MRHLRQDCCRIDLGLFQATQEFEKDPDALPAGKQCDHRGFDAVEESAGEDHWRANFYWLWKLQRLGVAPYILKSGDLGTVDFHPAITETNDIAHAECVAHGAKEGEEVKTGEQVVGKYWGSAQERSLPGRAAQAKLRIEHLDPQSAEVARGYVLPLRFAPNAVPPFLRGLGIFHGRPSIIREGGWRNAFLPVEQRGKCTGRPEAVGVSNRSKKKRENAGNLHGGKPNGAQTSDGFHSKKQKARPLPGRVWLSQISLRAETRERLLSVAGGGRRGRCRSRLAGAGAEADGDSREYDESNDLHVLSFPSFLCLIGNWVRDDGGLFAHDNEILARCGRCLAGQED